MKPLSEQNDKELTRTLKKIIRVLKHTNRKLRKGVLKCHS